MGKSFKKSPFTKFCGESDKKSKQFANRKFRRKETKSLQSRRYEEIPVNIREVSDTWDFVSDGLACYTNNPKYLRK